MSAVAGLVPKIEGFQPIPNAVMIPFMETQSAALAFGFGLNYEYGKRTIRSMSNEKFNSLTSEQISEMSANHSTVLLNRFIKAVPDVMPAQIEIFKQYVEIEKAKVLQNVELAKWIATNAPSIIITGKTASTDIKTTPTINNPPATSSSDVTSISQDAQGKVTTTTSSAQQKGGSFNPLVLTTSSPNISPKYNLTDKIYVTIKTSDGKNKTGLISWHRDMVLVWRNLALKPGRASSVKIYLDNTRIWSTIVKNLTGTWY